jgi:GH25 family lysozyme M1 (1,4-beta-N-acetylmuramidase)
MNDAENNTDALQSGTAEQHKIRDKRKRVIIYSFAAVIILLFAALFIITYLLSSRISSLSSRLNESEEYIAAVNSHVYEYASPDDTFTLQDKTYGEVWLPLFENVPLNTIDSESLVLDERNRYSYYDGEEKISYTGIDVSYHQGDIDWEKVAADGIDFVIVRVGYRGYESGIMKEDERADEYISGALAAGLDVGAYFYSQAVTEAEAAEEAVFAAELLKDYKITYPVIFDWELPGDSEARTADVSPETLNKCAAAFCSEISARGYTPMIYSGLTMALCKYDMRSMCSFDFWYVEYKDGHNPPLYPYEINMWQYASDGQVDGIDGNVDMNICFTDYNKLYNALHISDN